MSATLGLSEMGAGTIRRAARSAAVAGLQIEYSLLSRGIEDTILPTVRELGIGVTAYGVLSRGLLNPATARPVRARRLARPVPPVPGGNLERNLALVIGARCAGRRARRDRRPARHRLGVRPGRATSSR